MRNHYTLVRSTPDVEPITGGQILPDLTNLVLSQAGEQEDWDFGWRDKLFPVVPVGKWTIRIPTRFGEYLVRTDTSRGARADMRVISRKYGFQDLQLSRFSIASMVDKDEMANGDPWDISADAAMDARDGVKLDSAMRAQSAVLNTNNFGYNYNVNGSGTGNGFNVPSGLHLRDVVNTAIHTLVGDTGKPREAFSVALLGQSARDAALQDFEFRQIRAFKDGAGFPGYGDLATFLGVKEVWSASPIFRGTVDDAFPTPMFPLGSIIIYYAGVQARMPRGGLAWGRVFTLGGEGGALQPFFEEKSTSWYYPWELRENLQLFMPQCAASITNPLS